MKHLYGLLRLCLVALALFSVGSYAAAQLTAASKARNQARQDVVSVTMSRSMCFGSCPDYTVTIKADGSVEFDGRHYVKVKGKFTGSITKDDYNYLVRSINRFQFWTWEDHYDFDKPGNCKSFSTDSPTVIITVTTNLNKKQTSYYYGCRGFDLASKIDLLSRIIDDVADTQKWIGAIDERQL